VQAARANGERGQEQQQRGDAVGQVAQHAGDDQRQDLEQEEPPKLRPRRNPVEVDVFAQTGANRFRESHRLLPRAIWRACHANGE